MIGTPARPGSGGVFRSNPLPIYPQHNCWPINNHRGRLDVMSTFELKSDSHLGITDLLSMMILVRFNPSCNEGKSVQYVTAREETNA